MKNIIVVVFRSLKFLVEYFFSAVLLGKKKIINAFTSVLVVVKNISSFNIYI